MCVGLPQLHCILSATNSRLLYFTIFTFYSSSSHSIQRCSHRLASITLLLLLAVLEDDDWLSNGELLITYINCSSWMLPQSVIVPLETLLLFFFFHWPPKSPNCRTQHCTITIIKTTCFKVIIDLSPPLILLVTITWLIWLLSPITTLHSSSIIDTCYVCAWYCR